ncbi:hypothetical protein ACMHYB_06320 [Sorangium sp. So ce1128]
MDPLSLLCRLVASVPPRRFHTVKYAGVLASASSWRPRIGPRPAKPQRPAKADDKPAPKPKRSGYRAIDKPRLKTGTGGAWRACARLESGKITCFSNRYLKRQVKIIVP